MSPAPLVRGAAASALLLALGSGDTPEPPPAVVPPAAAARGAAGLTALCPERTVPEGAACIPLPAPDGPLPAGGAVAMAMRPGIEARSGATRSPAYDHIPRRPERPAAAAAYVYPIGMTGLAPAFLPPHEPSAGDGVATESPSPGSTFGASGRLSAPSEPRSGAATVVAGAAPEPPSWAGGVELAAARGERVAPITLDAQEGPTEVVFVGELFGITVATAHTVRESEHDRRYLVLYGHLDRPGPGVVPGARLGEGDTVGFAGETGSPGVVRLHLEARQIREGATMPDLDPKRLTDAAVTVPCDLRNVLPQR